MEYLKNKKIKEKKMIKNQPTRKCVSVMSLRSKYFITVELEPLSYNDVEYDMLV